jgi:hypothetical protein
MDMALGSELKRYDENPYLYHALSHYVDFTM